MVREGAKAKVEWGRKVGGNGGQREQTNVDQRHRGAHQSTKEDNENSEKEKITIKEALGTVEQAGRRKSKLSS